MLTVSRLRFLSRAACGLLTLAAVGLAGVRIAAAAVPQYSITQLKDSQGHPLNPHALNSKGDVAGALLVGFNSDQSPITHAGYTLNGVMKEVPFFEGLPATSSAEATGINDNGDVVGTQLEAPDFDTFGFLYRAGALTRLNDFFPGESFVAPTGINNAGEICGTRALSAFLLEPNGAIVDIDAGRAVGINNSGHVIGLEPNFSDPDFDGPPFFFADANHNGAVDAGELQLLPVPDNIASYSLGAISDDDRICGTLIDSAGRPHTVVWAVTGAGITMSELPGSPFGPQAGAIAHGINSNGDVVGIGGVGDVVLWPKSGPIAELQALIGSSSSTPTLTSAIAINNGGAIIGRAQYAGSQNEFGVLIKPTGGAKGPGDLDGFWGALLISHRGKGAKVVSTLTGTLTLENDGGAASKPTTVTFTFSADGVAHPGDTQLLNGGGKPFTLHIPAIPAGSTGAKSKRVVLSYRLPAGTTADSLAGRYVIAKIGLDHPDGSANLAVGGPVQVVGAQ